jgi:hypothetical protein
MPTRLSRGSATIPPPLYLTPKQNGTACAVHFLSTEYSRFQPYTVSLFGNLSRNAIFLAFYPRSNDKYKRI